MKVFIENEAGSDQKNIFNEKTLEYSRTRTVSALYPFPYGFLLETTSGDGDNLDCFVLTDKPFKSREIIEVEPIGMFEEIEDGEEDHKILAVPVGDSWTINAETENIFRDFSAKVFSHIPGKKKVLGRFLGKKEALELIRKSEDIKIEPDYTEFSDPRLVALYDTLNPFGDDSEFFCEQAKRLGAKRIIDLGCGTGLLTCELAKRGHEMVGVEPSEAMLAIARAKPYSDKIKWIQGSFKEMEGLHADMILMTSHVAQFFLDDNEWQAMLQAAHKALSTNGHLVFDIRRLSNPPFIGWPTEDNRRKFENTDIGAVEWWFKLLKVENGRVRYELHYFFVRSGEKVVSVNELAFRSQNEITEALSNAGFEIETIYGDWNSDLVSEDSPEMIFVAKRS